MKGARRASPKDVPTMMPQHTEKERALLKLLKIHCCATEQHVAGYLRELMAFDGDLSVQVEDAPGTMRATLSGSGALRAAVRGISRVALPVWPLQHISQHDEWFCPCGLSGSYPMVLTAYCPSCGSDLVEGHPRSPCS